MPFTPFHLGPALGLGVSFRKYIHAPTFILANVIIDIEPLLVILFNLRYPLHGYLHTFFSAFFLGLALGYIMFFFERFCYSLYRVIYLEPINNLNLKSFMLAGILGTILHVLLDSPLYSDIHPFYPLITNPLYNPNLAFEIYIICVFMGIFGIIYYVSLLVVSLYKRLH